VHLWDSIPDAGKDMACVRQFSTPDMLRIESYLFYPGDNSKTFPFDDETCVTNWVESSPDKIGSSGPKTIMRPRARSGSRFTVFNCLTAWRR
jgi:aminomethyltransferase